MVNFQFVTVNFCPGPKPLILDETRRHFAILHAFLAGRYWNARFQRFILWCVLDICRKQYQFYNVFWGRREPMCRNLRCWFSEMYDSMAQNLCFQASPEPGRAARSARQPGSAWQSQAARQRQAARQGIHEFTEEFTKECTVIFSRWFFVRVIFCHGQFVTLNFCHGGFSPRVQNRWF